MSDLERPEYTVTVPVRDTAAEEPGDGAKVGVMAGVLSVPVVGVESDPVGIAVGVAACEPPLQAASTVVMPAASPNPPRRSRSRRRILSSLAVVVSSPSSLSPSGTTVGPGLVATAESRPFQSDLFSVYGHPDVKRSRPQSDGAPVCALRRSNSGRAWSRVWASPKVEGPHRNKTRRTRPRPPSFAQHQSRRFPPQCCAPTQEPVMRTGGGRTGRMVLAQRRNAEPSPLDSGSPAT